MHAIRICCVRAQLEQHVTSVHLPRYVHYMQEVVENGGYYTTRLQLKTLSVHTCPQLVKGRGCNLWFTVEENCQEASPSHDPNPLTML